MLPCSMWICRAIRRRCRPNSSGLLELLEQAETIDDIITIESRLSDVRYQIESMESQLRTFDNQVSYSTVYLYIDEVKTYTQTEEQTRLQRMAGGFVNSLKGIGNGFLDFCVSFVIALPYLVVWAVIIRCVHPPYPSDRQKIKKEQREKSLKAADQGTGTPGCL